MGIYGIIIHPMIIHYKLFEKKNKDIIEFIDKLQGIESERVFSGFQMILAYANHIKDGQELIKVAKKTLLTLTMRKFNENIKNLEKKADFQQKIIEFNERLQGLQCERLFSAFQMILAYSNHIKDGQDLYKIAKKS